MAGTPTSPILSSISGAVLLLHIGVLLTFLLQEGCPPSQDLAPPLQIRIAQEPTSDPPLLQKASNTSLVLQDRAEQGPSSDSPLQESLLQDSPSQIAQIISPALPSPASSSPSTPSPRPSEVYAAKETTKAPSSKPVMASQPKGVASQPKGVASQPKGVASQPKGVASKTIQKPDPTPTARSAKPSAPPSAIKRKQSAEVQAALRRLKASAHTSAAESTPAPAMAASRFAKAGSSSSQSKEFRDPHRGIEGLIAALQNCVLLPEQGEVRMKLEINRAGKVIDVQVLKSGSKRNTAVIQRALERIQLPVEGLMPEGSHGSTLTVVVTFKHA